MFNLGISACRCSRGMLHLGQLGIGVHLTLVSVHSGVGGLCNTWVDEGGYIFPRYICIPVY